MKISEIVSVTLNTSEVFSGTVSADNLNNTAGVLIIIDGTGTSDTEWKTATTLLAQNFDTDSKAAFQRLVNTYSNNGGVNLVAKRIYADSLTEATLSAELIAAINGSDEHIKVDSKVINIMIVDEDGLSFSTIATTAQGVQNASSPEEEKIIMLNLSNAITYSGFGLSEIDNVFINYYDQRPTGAAAAQNNYEVALAAAYVSKINYSSDIVKGFEYTPFVGYQESSNNLNIVQNLPAVASNGNIYVNAITYLVNRYLAIGGVMTNGNNFIGKYFSIVLTQQITNELARLVISKLRFENATYSAISNNITALLDVFATNKLLDLEYISAIERNVVINEMSGDITYKTVGVGETFTQGYKVFTFPPSQADLANKTYSGVYIYIAIASQIHEISINGLLLGGI